MFADFVRKDVIDGLLGEIDDTGVIHDQIMRVIQIARERDLSVFDTNQEANATSYLPR